MPRSVLFVILSVALLTSSDTGWSQTTYTWISSTGGSWTTASNWSPERSEPAADDKLIINNSGSITDVPTETIGELQITGGVTVSLSCITAVTLTVSGDFEVAASCSLSVGTNITIALNGSFTNYGGISSGGNGHFELTGTDDINIASGSANSMYMIIDGNRTVSSAGAVASNNWEILLGKTLTIASGVTFRQAGSIAVGGTINGSGTLQVEGNIGGSGQVSVDVVFAGAGIRNLTFNLNVTGDVTVNSGTTVRGLDHILSVTGTLTNNGTIQDDEGPLSVTVDGSIVNNDTWINTLTTLTGTGTMSGTAPMGGDVTVSSTGLMTLTNGMEVQGTLTVDGELTVSASTTLTSRWLKVNDKITGENATSSVILFEGSAEDQHLEFPDVDPGATLSKIKIRSSGDNLRVNFSGVCNLESGASFEIDNSSTLRLSGSGMEWVINGGVGGGAIDVVSGKIDVFSQVLTLEGLSTNSLTLNVGTGGVVYDYTDGDGKIITKGNVTIAQGGTFQAPLEVSSGTTTAWNEEVEEYKLLPGPGLTPPLQKGMAPALQGRNRTGLVASTYLTSFDGNLQVQSGAVMVVPSGKSVMAGSSPIDIEGTVNGPGYFLFLGPVPFTNNGTVSAPTFIKPLVEDHCYIVGDGVWSDLTIEPDASVRLSSSVSLTSSNITNHGSLEVYSYAFKLVNSTFTNASDGYVNGSYDSFETEGTVAIIQQGTFTETLVVRTGTTTAEGVFDEPIIVKPLGTLTIEAAKTLTANDNVTVERDYPVEEVNSVKSRRVQMARSSAVQRGMISGAGNLVFQGCDAAFQNEGNVDVATTFVDNDGDLKTISGVGGSWKLLIVDAGCTISVAGAQTLIGNGATFIVNGAVLLQSGSMISYAGTSLQTISPLTYYGLEINNPGGAYLPESVTVNESLDMTSGNLATYGYTLYLGSNATIDELGGTVIGRVYTSRTCTTGTNQEFGGVGIELNAQGYTPFPSKVQTLQAGSSSFSGFNVTVNRYTGTAPTMSGVTFVKRYFDLSTTGDGLNATLEFYYRTDELNGTTEASLQLYSSTDNGVTWTPRGGTVDAANNKITLSGVNSLSWWTAGHTSGTSLALVSISPSSGDQGHSVTVTITGTGFIAGVSSLSFSGSGITVVSTSVSSETQLMGAISIASIARPGSRDVTVTNGGSSATLSGAFEVTIPPNPPPLLTSVAPTMGARGQSLTVTLSGGGFLAGLSSVSFGDGITVSGAAATSSSTMTAQIAIQAGTTNGVRTVSVTNPAPGGGTASLVGGFSVVNPSPTIASISPASGTRGQSQNVVVTGTNYYSGVTSLSLGSGITVDSVVVLSNTQVQARLSISFEAASGARNVSVTNAVPGGGSATLTGGFMVNNPVPTITAVAPAAGARGKSVTVTIAGTNFVTGSTSVSAGGGITVGSVTVVSSTQLTATVSIARSVALGAKDLTVTNGAPGGGVDTLRGGFTVQNPVPVASSVSPGTGILGQTLSVVVVGTDLFSGITTVDFGAGIMANSTAVDTNGTQVTVNLTISPTAAVGNRSITLTNSAPGGGTATLANAFVVHNPAPTLTSVRPNVGGKSQTLEVSVVGTNFISGVTSVEFGLGITVGAVTVNSSTSLTVSITVNGNTITGARSVSVTNAAPGGGKATLASVFNVENLAPTITGVSPGTGSRGESVAVTVTGTGFSSGTTAIDFGTGITVGSLAVADPTQISATLTIAEGAALGARNVVVTNPPPGGGNATLTNGFLVGNPSPSVTGLSPALAARGQSITVTVTGTGFSSGVTSISFGPNIDVTSINVLSPTQLAAAITVASGAATGARNVEVTNPAPGGGTGGLTGGFSVTNPAPTIAGITPNQVLRGGTASVTVTGTEFINGVTSLVVGSGLTVTSSSVQSSTQLQAAISVGSDAAAGVRDVSVTNSGPGGGTATLSGAFTVTNPAPTIGSLSMASAGRGSLLNVVVTGTQFISGVTSVSFGPDITVTSSLVKSATEMQVSISIGVTAATGVRAVSVTNPGPGGGTATLTGGFNVTTSPATGVEGELGIVPDEYVLQEAYPNPFNPSTRIRYGIPENSRVELIVHNMLGNVVAQLISGERSKGLYELLWHAENLPSGVYLIRLHAESIESTKRFIASRKVVLVK